MAERKPVALVDGALKELSSSDFLPAANIPEVTAAVIHAAPSKTTPVDADELGLSDSAASWGLKKLTFANLAAWARGVNLTGLSTATNAVITAADTVLSALGKLQKQISGHLANTTGAHAASAVTYTPAGTGALPTTVQAKLRQTVSVLDFGADPTGVASANTAINNAIATGKDVFFPGGAYRITSTITISGDDRKLYGERSTVLRRDAAQTIFLISGNENKLVDLTFDGNKANYPSPAFARSSVIQITGDYNVIENCHVDNGNSHGILLSPGAGANLVDGCAIRNNDEVGIAHDGGTDNLIVNNQVVGSGFEAITLDQGSFRCIVDGNRLGSNCQLGGVGAIGVDGTDLSVISNNQILASKSGKSGITFQNNLASSASNLISGNIFGFNEGHAVWLRQRLANMLTYSEEFGNADWSKGNSSITANAGVAPDSTTTADKLVENTSNSTHNVQQNTRTYITGEPYTASVYAKAAERSVIELWYPGTIFPANRNAVFTLTGSGTASHTGTGTASIQYVGSGWYRCIFTLTCTSGGVGYGCAINLNNGSTITYTGDGTSGAFIWGAMLTERSPVDVLPYQKTTNTTLVFQSNANTITGNVFRNNTLGSVKIDAGCQGNVLSGNYYGVLPDIDPASFNTIDNGLVFFRATNTVTRTDVTGNSATYQIPFNNLANERNATASFNTTTGTFTAPISGIYSFSAGCRTTGGAVADFAVISIVTGAGTITNSVDYTDKANQNVAVSGSIILQKNQTAYVTIRVGGEASNVVDVSNDGNQTFFTGVLIG